MNGIEQLKRKIKNQNCPPVIALSGEERALIDEALTILRAAFLDDASADFNHHRFSAVDDDEPDLSSALLTMPFLARYRLVEVHNVEKLSADTLALVIDYVEKPCPTSILVLLYQKADKRNKLLASLTAKEAHFVLSVDAEQERRNYLLAVANEHELSLAKDAADFLLTITDGDLLSLKNAVEKLALVGPKITIDHIEQQIVADGEQDVFVLARAISEGRLADSLIALGRLRNSHENAIKFLGVLMWQLRVLVNIRSCIEQGMADFDIRKAVNVYGDRFSWMAHIAKKKNLDFHVDRLTKLTDCDRALKTSATLEPFHVLEKFVYQCAATDFTSSAR